MLLRTHAAGVMDQKGRFNVTDEVREEVPSNKKILVNDYNNFNRCRTHLIIN